MENEGGFFSRRMMGLPAWVWLAGAAVLAWWWFSRQSGGTPGISTTGGGGQVHTGKTVVQSGAVRINVSGGGGGGVDNPQPKPPQKYTGPVKAISVNADESLSDLAAYRHWSDETLTDVEALVQPKGSYQGQQLSADTQLKKGQTIYRPIGRGKAEQGI